jgi:hypothetical protein
MTLMVMLMGSRKLTPIERQTGRALCKKFMNRMAIIIYWTKTMLTQTRYIDRKCVIITELTIDPKKRQFR